MRLTDLDQRDVHALVSGTSTIRQGDPHPSQASPPLLWGATRENMRSPHVVNCHAGAPSPKPPPKKPHRYFIGPRFCKKMPQIGHLVRFCGYFQGMNRSTIFAVPFTVPVPF